MHVLRNVFESNWCGPGNTNSSPREKRKKKKKKPAKEIVGVVDNEDEDDGEKKANLPTSLDQAWTTAFSLNLVNPNVTAKASSSAQA